MLDLHGLVCTVQDERTLMLGLLGYTQKSVALALRPFQPQPLLYHLKYLEISYIMIKACGLGYETNR
jgi:hypothetical protein